MAAMSTILTEFSDNGNSRQYTLSDHSFSDVRKVLQKRVEGVTVLEDQIMVLYSTTDANSAPMAQKVSFTVIVKRPRGCAAADVTSSLAVFRDIVAGDEFTNTVNTQEWVK